MNTPHDVRSQVAEMNRYHLPTAMRLGLEAHSRDEPRLRAIERDAKFAEQHERCALAAAERGDSSGAAMHVGLAWEHAWQALYVARGFADPPMQ